MKEDYKRLFANLEPPEPPVGLFDKIFQGIHKKQHLLIIKRRIALFSIGVVGSAAAFIPVFQMTKSALAESGFMQFFSLFFSDFEVLTAYWHNFALALLESLPVISIAALLGTIFIFIGSLKFLTRDIKVALSSLKS